MLFVINDSLPSAEVPTSPVTATLAVAVTDSSPKPDVATTALTPETVLIETYSFPKADVPATPVTSTGKGLLQAPSPQVPLPQPLIIAIVKLF